MKYKGISYDTGTNYAPGYLSRPIWGEEQMLREVKLIVNELHCNSMQIYGSDIQRIVLRHS